MCVGWFVCVRVVCVYVFDCLLVCCFGCGLIGLCVCRDMCIHVSMQMHARRHVCSRIHECLYPLAYISMYVRMFGLSNACNTRCMKRLHCM